jgi:hypothetical protein
VVTTSPAEMSFTRSVFNLQGHVTSGIRALWSRSTCARQTHGRHPIQLSGNVAVVFSGKRQLFGSPSDLTQFNLVVNFVRERDAADGQNHLRRQLLVAL